MKLYVTAPSPFARKCRIVAREKGLAGRIEEVVVDPYGDDPLLVAANPIVQVPTLIAEDGRPVTDSPLICDWLDEIGSGPRLCPPSGAGRLEVKRREALGNAALEMGVKMILEKRRPEHERSSSWMARWTTNLGRALDALEASDLEGEPDIARLTAAVAVSWIDFRHPDIDWRPGRPRLVALQAAMEARPSFVETRPA